MSFLLITINVLFVYISIRLYKAFFSKINFLIVVPAIFFLSYMFIIVRIISKVTSLEPPVFLFSLSYIILAIVISLILVFALFDIFRILPPVRRFYKKFALKINLSLLAIALTFFGYGYYNQSRTFVTPYDITFSKPLAKPLKIVALADIHVAKDTSKERMKSQVETINALKPDIVFLVGDIIDVDLKDFTPDYRKILSEIKAPLGVYGALGNHEYISGNPFDAVELLTDAGINILLNDTLYFEEHGFNLVGRDSLRHSNSGGSERMPVSAIAAKIQDKSKPTILLDHIPRNTEDGKTLGADLQISGHTHGGQFFPNQFIVNAMFPIAYGHLQEGDFNLIVTSGLGLWGPPMRVGSKSEIVVINAK